MLGCEAATGVGMEEEAQSDPRCALRGRMAGDAGAGGMEELYVPESVDVLRSIGVRADVLEASSRREPVPTIMWC